MHFLLCRALSQIWQLYTGMNTNGNTSGTPYANVPAGYTWFLGEPPRSGGVWNYREVVGFSNVYSAITEQCPIHLRLAKNGGHAVFVLGRAQSVLGSKYLIILDGWNKGGVRAEKSA